MKRQIVSALMAGVTALVLTGCELPDFGAPRGASKQGQEIFNLWRGSVAAALAVGAVVWALIFFVIFRYRRRRRDEGGEPSQRQYNLTIEIGYTVLPLIIVAVLFYFTVDTQQKVTEIAANPAARVEVTAFQWGWTFEYLDTNVTVVTQGEDPPTLTLPVNQTTRVTLRATDVVHSFFIPGFLYKRDAIPGFENTFDLTPTRTGEFLGRCAEFCGLRHAQMLFNVKVVSPDEFRRVVAPEGTGP